MKDDAVQLLARGAQDVWLTGDPQVSFYRSSFKRHVPFATSIEYFPVSDGKILINPKCDLLSYVYLTAHDKTTGALVPGLVWSTIIQTADLIMGNQYVATHDMTYVNTIQKSLEARTYSQRASTSFQPLGFFFDIHPLPIIALKYTDVYIRLLLDSQVYKLKCWAHCIHLGEDERKYFSTTPQKILIPQMHRVRISNEPCLRGPIKYLAAPCVNYVKVNTPIPTSATGGTVTTYSNYKVHTFTTSGTFTITSGGSFDILCVGGGGAAMDIRESGYGFGGGGGYVQTSSVSLSPQSIPITIGSGGYSINIDSSPSYTFVDGTASSFGSILTALPGGPGSGYGFPVGTIRYGGGSSQSGTPSDGSSGGSGAGTIGGPLNGGDGILSSISGTPTYYGGGGGGANSPGYGIGGLGGGGNGSSYYSGVETDGQPNTGGGAGATDSYYSYPHTSKRGGSGIVIIRYKI